MARFTLDSRYIQQELLNLKSDHSLWVKRFIDRLGLVEGVDYIRRKEGRKHTYRFTDDVLMKMEAKPAEVDVTDVVQMPNAPEGFQQIDGKVYLRSTVMAQMFEKLHKNVLRDIKDELAKIEQLLQDSSKTSSVVGVACLAVKTGVIPTQTIDPSGKAIPEYLLDQCAALAIASRYSTSVRCRLAHAYIQYQSQLEKYINKALSSIDNRKLGHVYIIHNIQTGSNKIGVSIDPDKRLKGASAMNEHDLVLMYQTPMCDNYFNIEARAHEHFKSHVIRGEWFDSSLPIDSIVA